MVVPNAEEDDVSLTKVNRPRRQKDVLFTALYNDRERTYTSKKCVACGGLRNASYPQRDYMFDMFSKKQTPKEAATLAKQETKKEVRSSQREIDREIRHLELEEKKVLIQIKQRARQPGVRGNDDPALRSMAKNIVQIRNQRDKLFQARANLGAVGMQATTMFSQVAAAHALGTVTSALSTANTAVNAKEMSSIMNEFTRINERMNISEEVMDDALSSAFDNDAIEEEADNVTSQVLAELGIELDQKMIGLSAPSNIPKQQQLPVIEEPEDALLKTLPDLNARLKSL